MMGGTIGVNSRYGEGSNFYFTIRAERMVEEKRSVVAPGLQGRRLLVVDDNIVVRNILLNLLQSYDCEVTAVDSGTEALRHLADGGRFDAMIIDWRMEPIDGLETVRLMRQRLREGQQPQVILLSAHNEAELTEATADLELQAVLTKPVLPNLLYDTLIELLFHSQRSTKPHPKLASAQAVAPTFGGAHLLLVEDNATNRELAHTLLQQLGAEITIATNGAEAIAQLNQGEPFDGVLMDCQMPLMDAEAVK